MYQIGEEGFLEELVQKNIKTFSDSEAETVITVSPHCLNMFKNIYPHYGKMPNVLHYTEILSQFIDHRNLEVKRIHSAGAEGIQVTIHDPFYLGRYYGIYE